ncbi:MAG: disulfide bond chaperone [Roseibacillus sp.]|nr:disulfide bond chaperone [Roseibacillus sp.]
MQHGIRHTEELDSKLKDAMAMLVLHLVARPWAETIAWTASLRAPRVNLFVTGSSINEQITGRCFTEDVREPPHNLFYSQTTVADKEPRMSSLQLDTSDPLEWVEKLYECSEQRPGRIFRLSDENYVLLAAQPDFDEDWFHSIDAQDVASIQQAEETKTLETRRFRWNCGCDLDRILPILGGWREKPDELFKDEPAISIQCPRCAAKFSVTRDMI